MGGRVAGRFSVASVVAVAVLLPAGTLTGQNQATGSSNSSSSSPEFHGTYEELKPSQKQLVDE
jgi:hypothetical protein